MDRGDAAGPESAGPRASRRSLRRRRGTRRDPLQAERRRGVSRGARATSSWSPGRSPCCPTTPAGRPRAPPEKRRRREACAASATPSPADAWRRTPMARAREPGPGGVGRRARRARAARCTRASSTWARRRTTSRSSPAILRALEWIPPGAGAIVVHTDSQYAIGVLTKGWKAKANQELIAKTRSWWSERGAQLVYVPGHQRRAAQRARRRAGARGDHVTPHARRARRLAERAHCVAAISRTQRRERRAVARAGPPAGRGVRRAEDEHEVGA